MSNSGKRWAFLLLPVSVMILSITYSLVMIVRVPVIVDVIEVDPVSWSLERPMEVTEFSEEATNVYKAGLTILKFTLRWFEYKESNRAFPFNGRDGFIIGVNATGSVNDGFVHSLFINFSIEDENAFLNIVKQHSFWERSLHNFMLQEIREGRPVSYISILGEKEERDCSMMAQGYWVFLDQHDVDHQITVTMDAVWFNGTAYLRTILPIQLEVTIS